MTKDSPCWRRQLLNYIQFSSIFKRKWPLKIIEIDRKAANILLAPSNCQRLAGVMFPQIEKGMSHRWVLAWTILTHLRLTRQARPAQVFTIAEYQIWKTYWAIWIRVSGYIVLISAISCRFHLWRFKTFWVRRLYNLSCQENLSLKRCAS